MDDDNWRRYHSVLLQLSCKPTGHTHGRRDPLSLLGCGTCGYGYLFVSRYFHHRFNIPSRRTIHYGTGYIPSLNMSPLRPIVRLPRRERESRYRLTTHQVRQQTQEPLGCLTRAPRLASFNPVIQKKKISIVQRKTVTPSLWGEPLEGYCDFHCWERSNPVETLLSSDDMIRESSAKPSFREPNTAKKDAARTTAGNGIGSSAESTNAEGKGNGSGRCRASSPPPVEASRHKIFTGLGPCSTAN